MKNEWPEEEIVAWADTFLPGDGLFPAASATPMLGPLKERLSAADGGRLLDRMGAAITGKLAPLAPVERRTALQAFERNDPKLFDEARKIFYVTYYEQDGVVAAIRDLGIPYNPAPLPEGYPAEAFDAETDAPKHRRGRWVPTERVARINLDALAQAGKSA